MDDQTRIQELEAKLRELEAQNVRYQREAEEAIARQVDRRREAQEAKARQVKHQREADEAKAQQVKHQREYERKDRLLRRTNLFEFLDACYTELFANLSVSEKSSSTSGHPANAMKKIRPDHIRYWDSFALEQEEIWAALMASDFAEERHFMSSQTLKDIGAYVKRKPIGSELDLNSRHSQVIDSNVEEIVRMLYGNVELRTHFSLKGDVYFENHANTLSPEDITGELESMSLTETDSLPKSQQHATKLRVPNPKAAAREVMSKRPSADQYCVYNVANEDGGQRIPAFVVEYKAPHKVTLGHIYGGLCDMDVDDVVKTSKSKHPSLCHRRLVAALITQVFSYMVRLGVEFGCVSTGIAFIFLRIPDDPRTVQYYVSVPKGDVGESTGWTHDASSENRLHLTAVGQMLAFTLRALKTPPRSQIWRSNAASQLKTWTVSAEEILKKVSDDELSSDYQPPRKDDYIRMSPVRLRPRVNKVAKTQCRSNLANVGHFDGENSDSDTSGPKDADPDTPCPPRGATRRSDRIQTRDSKTTKSKSRTDNTERSYCTHKCLLGLVAGGLLDKKCPNVELHGEGARHTINYRSFLQRMRQQLFTNPDEGCEEFGRPGSRGVLFKVRLLSHGYTMAAKGTASHFIPYLKHEASMYCKLQPIQGRHVPVCVGSINLKRPWFYQGFAEVVHMIFLSYCGRPISQTAGLEKTSLKGEIRRSLQAVHKLGVLHCDAEARNLLWHEGQVLVIDFERAKIVEQRHVLGDVSPNKTRQKTKQSLVVKDLDEWEDGFKHELNRALAEANGIV